MSPSEGNPESVQRRRIVSFARAIVHSSANPGDAASRQKYIALVAPAEAPHTQSRMALAKGDALTVAGIWRACGLYEQGLNAPYRHNTAASRLIGLGEKYHAWIPSSAGAIPHPGDMVLLQEPEHVFTVLSVARSRSKVMIQSVEGGHEDHGHQLVLKKTRTWSNGLDETGETAQKIAGWVDVSKLPFSTGPLVRGFVQGAPAGRKGIDTYQKLNRARIAELKRAGYDFCVRSLSHELMESPADLTHEEAQVIIDAGFGLMGMQRPPAPPWHPTSELGREHGQCVAANAKAVGLPMCVNLWLPLDAVARGTNPQDVIDYCEAWYFAVYSAGFTPGLRVGPAPGLSAEQLHEALHVQHYWRSKDPATPDVAVQGYQMVQAAETGRAEGENEDRAVDDEKGERAQWLVSTPIV